MIKKEPWRTIIQCLLLLGAWAVLFFSVASSQSVGNKNSTFGKGRVIDGDSFYYKGVEYRLACIDAYEYDHPKGGRATAYLKFWLSKDFDLETVGKGYYNSY